MVVVILLFAALVVGACGDEGSAGPDAGYTVHDIVANPGHVVGKEVAVSGEAALVVSPEQVVEGSVARVTGRVVEMPLDAAETSPDIAASLRGASAKANTPPSPATSQ